MTLGQLAPCFVGAVAPTSSCIDYIDDDHKGVGTGAISVSEYYEWVVSGSVGVQETRKGKVEALRHPADRWHWQGIKCFACKRETKYRAYLCRASIGIILLLLEEAWAHERSKKYIFKRRCSAIPPGQNPFFKRSTTLLTLMSAHAMHWSRGFFTQIVASLRTTHTIVCAFNQMTPYRLSNHT